MKIEYYVMSEGHFEKGRWVEDNEKKDHPNDQSDDINSRVREATTSFGKGLDDLLSVGRELVTTEEGRRHIGRSMDKAGADIMTALEDAARSASDYISSILDQKQKK